MKLLWAIHWHIQGRDSRALDSTAAASNLGQPGARARLTSLSGPLTSARLAPPCFTAHRGAERPRRVRARAAQAPRRLARESDWKPEFLWRRRFAELGGCGGGGRVGPRGPRRRRRRGAGPQVAALRAERDLAGAPYLDPDATVAGPTDDADEHRHDWRRAEAGTFVVCTCLTTRLGPR